jgi:hypothetical protein
MGRRKRGRKEIEKSDEPKRGNGKIRRKTLSIYL